MMKQTAKISIGTHCIYRESGSTTAQIVKVVGHRGSAIGHGFNDEAMVWNFYVDTEPAIDSICGVYECYLSPLGSANPMRLAAQFLDEMLHDSLLIHEVNSMCKQRPRLTGEHLVEVVPPANDGATWMVVINGQIVAEAEGHYRRAFERLIATLNETSLN